MPYVTNIYVVAAICGNFWQESTVNPGIWENLTENAPGYGLGQWTDNPSIGLYRRTDLFNYLETNGYSLDDGNAQLQYLILENSWVPTGAGYQSDYDTLTEFLESTSTNLSDLVYEFFHHWEGIDDGTGNVRLQFAEELIDNVFPDDDGTRNPWYKGNFYLTRSQAKSNALLIKDFLMGTTPPVPPIPPHTRKRKGLPVWLMYKLSKGEI